MDCLMRNNSNPTHFFHKYIEIESLQTHSFQFDAWICSLINLPLLVLISSNVLTSFYRILNIIKPLLILKSIAFFFHFKHFPSALHLQVSCKKDFLADSGHSGDHWVHCHTPHFQQRENPEGNLADPRNAQEINQHCRHKRKKHDLVLWCKFYSQFHMNSNNTSYSILILCYTVSAYSQNALTQYCAHLSAYSWLEQRQCKHQLYSCYSSQNERKTNLIFGEQLKIATGSLFNLQTAISSQKQCICFTYISIF